MKRIHGWNGPRWTWLLVAGLVFSLGCLALAQNKPTPPTKEDSGTEVTKIAADDVESCLGCHESDVSHTIKAVSAKAIEDSPHKGMKCQDCHTSVDGAPHTPGMMKEKAECANCHSDQADQFAASAHAKADKVAGDHPKCVTCHGGGDAHAIKPVKAMTRVEKVEMCSNCHRQTDRMSRYGVDPDAVPSYEESFHGKAMLRFHDQKAAICSDCHGAHTMLNPGDPKATVSRENAAKTCSQKGCHQGAQVNFAISGANHLRLKMKTSPVLLGIYIFFRVLTFAMLAFMLGGVGLDLRRKVFGPKPPRSGRFVGLCISLSYILVIVALVSGLFGQSNVASTLGIVALSLLALAYLAYFLNRKNLPKEAHGRKFQRFDRAHRWQHVLLMLSFTTLILTGLPQRFFNVPWLANLYIPFGGLSGARYVHRVAAMGLIIVFLWHTSELLIRWARNGFSFKSWTMFPTVKDFHDFVAVSKNYLGISHEEPKFDRFQFKQKMDYLAEYWGIPLMVVTGFIQWFPVYWGNRLPEIALPAAAVAHSWEATLAFVAIVTWHIYNEHFNPDAFPMSKVWLTGDLSQEEMEREHPLELERILAEEEPKPETPEAE